MWRKLHGKITKRPTNFSWVLGDKLAGSGMPTTSEEFDWTLKQGIKSVVTLTENSLPESWIDGIEYLHVPTEDLTAPDMDKIEHAVDFIYGQIRGGKPVMVHCAAGMGRAGTILACYLIKYKKYSAKQAISKIREDRPGSIQSETQEIAISLFEKHISKK